MVTGWQQNSSPAAFNSIPVVFSINHLAQLLNETSEPSAPPRGVDRMRPLGEATNSAADHASGARSPAKLG